jgi:hypothetical protein
MFDFPRIIPGKSELTVDYTVEMHAFPYIVERHAPLRGIILRKSKLSLDYTTERNAFRRYNPPKGM